jgi:ABC-2 type transport system permease protein
MEMPALERSKSRSNLSHEYEKEDRQNGVSFPGMVRGELMKITWLRSTWIMLVVVISGTALLPLFNILAHNVHELLLLHPVQYAYNYEFSQNLLMYRALSGFFALLVAAFAVGLDYQQGTLRVILGRGAGRMRFLCSKIVALFLFAILVQLGGLVLNGMLLMAVVEVSTGNLAAVGVMISHCAGTFALYFLYLLFNMWVSILLATAVTVLGRSLTFGLSVALLWFPVDNFLALLTELFHSILPGNFVLHIGNVLLGPALNVLPSVAISSQIPGQMFVPALPGSEGQTMLVILIYALVFLGSALALVRYRDVA